MRNSLELFIAIALSALFTVALIYATVEAPRVVNNLLLHIFPDYHLEQTGEIRQITEALKPLGYISFAVILILIVAGFIVQKARKLATIGAVFMYLPTFGYFAFTMFFLAGIGIIRILWFPLLEGAPSFLRLGEIIYLLSFILSLPFAFLGINIGVPLSFILMGVGIFVFFLSVLTWLYGRFKKLEMIDFCIYRYSRHPQYLGFLTWSYGLLLLTSSLEAPRGGYVPPPTLPWLISALTIIGIALHEENIMIKKHGEKYARYLNRTPFLIPIPKKLSTLITAPVRLLLKKNRPENGREIALTMTVYGTILVLLSIPLVLFSSI